MLAGRKNSQSAARLKKQTHARSCWGRPGNLNGWRRRRRLLRCSVHFTPGNFSRMVGWEVDDGGCALRDAPGRLRLLAAAALRFGLFFLDAKENSEK